VSAATRPPGADDMITYDPMFAKHVKGWYEKARLGPDNTREPQKVYMICEVCGQKAQRECLRGVPRQHITVFAQLHMHVDFARPKARPKARP
jgi:hypothetical protein